MGEISVRSFRAYYKITALFLVLTAVVSLTGLCFSDENVLAATEGNSSYIVMNADTYEVIKEGNSDKRLPMASTTKTMTALLVVEHCIMDDIVVVPEQAVGVEGSSVYLKEGETYTVRELLYGLMLRSGNDAAIALAIHVAGTVENFVEMMNYRAEMLGLKNTHFVNPHGLHNNQHYTSAYDLCKLGCYAIKNDIFADIVSTKQAVISSDNTRKVWCNKNKILSLYDGGIGIKTGFTKAAGRCLIAGAEREGHTVVSVVLNRGDMYEACMELMDEAFEKISADK